MGTVFEINWTPREQTTCIRLTNDPDDSECTRLTLMDKDGDEVSVLVDDDELDRLCRYLEQMKTEPDDE